MTDAARLEGLAAPPALPGQPPRPPWLVWLGLAVVLAAAAVLSFSALRDLAAAAGIDPGLAWLLPVCVDAGAAVSSAVWLGRRSPDDAAGFAGRLTLALLATTVLGNAGQLGMHAYGITPPWWVAAVVGGIAPAVVWCVVHLVVLLTRRSRAVQTTETTETTETGEVPKVADGDDELLPAVRDFIAAQTGPVSQRAIRSEFGVGPVRAKKLMEAA